MFKKILIGAGLLMAVSCETWCADRDTPEEQGAPPRSRLRTERRARRTTLDVKDIEFALNKLNKFSEETVPQMFRRSNEYREDSRVLLLGKTGVGKSTLMCQILGAPVYVERDEFGSLILVPQEEAARREEEHHSWIGGLIDRARERASSICQRFKVGHSFMSCTTLPNSFNEKFRGWWDCPGALDNRVQEERGITHFQELLNQLAIKFLLNGDKPAKIVLVMSPEDISDKAHVGKVFKYLTGMFSPPLDALRNRDFSYLDALKNGNLLIVMNKAGPDFRINFLKRMQGIPYLEEAERDLINYLTHDNQIGKYCFSFVKPLELKEGQERELLNSEGSHNYREALRLVKEIETGGGSSIVASKPSVSPEAFGELKALYGSMEEMAEDLLGGCLGLLMDEIKKQLPPSFGAAELAKKYKLTGAKNETKKRIEYLQKIRAFFDNVEQNSSAENMDFLSYLVLCNVDGKETINYRKNKELICIVKLMGRLDVFKVTEPPLLLGEAWQLLPDLNHALGLLKGAEKENEEYQSALEKEDRKALDDISGRVGNLVNKNAGASERLRDKAEEAAKLLEGIVIDAAEVVNDAVNGAWRAVSNWWNS